MSAALSEERDTIEEMVEPYLIQQGLLMRTPRGRVLAEGAYRHLGLSAPKNIRQLELLAQNGDGNELASKKFGQVGWSGFSLLPNPRLL